MNKQIPNLKMNEQYQSPAKKISHIKKPDFDDQAVVENWKGLDMMWGKKEGNILFRQGPNCFVLQ